MDALFTQYIFSNRVLPRLFSIAITCSVSSFQA
jgi:hypothetical protein